MKGLFALLLIGLLVMTACSTSYTQEELDNALATLAGEHQAELGVLDEEITSLMDEKSSLESDVTNNEVRIAELETALADAEANAEAEAEVIETPTVVKFSGKTIDDLELGDSVVFKLDDGDVDHLLDTRIDFNGDNYDVHEEFEGSNLVIALNGYGYDEEFGGEPYLVLTDKEALTYTFVFDDSVTVTDVTDDEPLEIVFLGTSMKIVYADDNELEVELGTELLLNQGESYEYNDLPLTLIAVSSDEAFVSYNGKTDSLNEGQSRKIGGVEIKLVEAFESDIGEGSAFAKLVVGDEVETTLEDGDDYLDDERFIFSMNVVADELLSLSVTYDIKSDELDDDYAPLAVGDVITFPNEYMTMEFAEITDVSYIDVDVSLDKIDAEDDLLADENGYVLEADEDIIEVDNEEVDELFILASGLYYYNDDNELVLATDTTATIVNDDFELTVELVGEVLTFTDDNGDLLEIDGDLTNLYFGSLEEDAEATDVVYAGLSFGTQNYDLLTGTGYIVKNVEDNADNDEVHLSVPSDIVEATVLVY